jgi:hypothetical protein
MDLHWTDYISFAGWALMFIFFVIDLPTQLAKIKNRRRK